MEPEAGWGAVAAVAEPDHGSLAPGEDQELSSLAGFFRTLCCSPVPAGGVFSEPGPGRVGRTIGLCAHRVERRAFGRPLLAAPGPGAGRRNLGGRRRALAFPGLRSGLAAGHDGRRPRFWCWSTWGWAASAGGGVWPWWAPAGISPRPGGFSAMPRPVWPWG